MIGVWALAPAIPCYLDKIMIAILENTKLDQSQTVHAPNATTFAQMVAEVRQQYPDRAWQIVDWM